jgi:hypothetical protein
VDQVKQNDSIDIIETTRYAPVVLNGGCISQITGLLTS